MHNYLLFRFQVQQPLPKNQDIQQSLEFIRTLHHIHLHHLLGQVIAANPQHKFQHYEPHLDSR